MGIVINEEVAKTTPCKCFQLKADELLCFSKGILGAMSDPQEEIYCTEKHIEPATHGQKKRIAAFTEAVQQAKERYEAEGKPGKGRWQELVGEEAEKKGVRI